MAEDRRMTAAQVVDKVMGSEHVDVVRESVAWLVAELMDAEVSAQIGAELGEVTAERVNRSVACDVAESISANASTTLLRASSRFLPALMVPGTAGIDAVSHPSSAGS